ncbi:MAG: class I SAM-dependent methyltransferase [Nitrospiraceae bacterium]|jgi:16S rRNA (guanine527-N7)-methyltransferase|nr:class I SAM-dependent methyltransferase [Nitrospiraceae bacterium]
MTFEQKQKLGEYERLLLEWNSRLRLTGFVTLDAIRRNLVLEPLSASRYFSLSSDPHPVVDLGSGNGSPGLIFAILNPDRPVYLIERRQKKMTFLLYAAGKLNLSNVHVLEDISMIRPLVSGNVVDVWSKAVSWEDLLKACTPLLPRFAPVRIRKFGEDSPSFTCSSTAVHGITFEEFSCSEKKSGLADFYVTEAILTSPDRL